MSHSLSPGRCFSCLALCAALSLAGCGAASSDPVADQSVVEELRLAANTAGDGDDGATAAVVGTGWGTLRGRFVVVGTPPDPGTVATGGKEAPVCKDGQPSTSLLVAGDGGLANVAVYARKVSRVHESFAELIVQPAEFDQKACVFLERVKVVYVGQTVIVKNSDPFAHNTSSSPSGDTAFNNQIGAGGSFEHVFKKAQSEPQPVACNVHNWMKAFILPRKDPYAVVSAADGSFEIANVPAGEPIEFQAWHERSSGSNGALSGQGDDVSINAKGRFKVTVPEDGVLDLGEIRVPASALK
jgi:hypothetical protein